MGSVTAMLQSELLALTWQDDILFPIFLSSGKICPWNKIELVLIENIIAYCLRWVPNNVLRNWTSVQFWLNALFVSYCDLMLKCQFKFGLIYFWNCKVWIECIEIYFTVNSRTITFNLPVYKFDNSNVKSVHWNISKSIACSGCFQYLFLYYSSQSILNAKLGSNYYQFKVGNSFKIILTRRILAILE